MKSEDKKLIIITIVLGTGLIGMFISSTNVFLKIDNTSIHYVPVLILITFSIITGIGLGIFAIMPKRKSEPKQIIE